MTTIRRPRVGSILAGFGLIAGFLLLTEHRAHLFGVLPWLLLLACPFLHLFSHGGHGHTAHRMDPAANHPPKESNESAANGGAL